MAIKDFIGKWRIYEMELWEQDDFDARDKAYIKIGKDKQGEFQFSYLFADIDGKIIKYPDGEKLEFTWEGEDGFEEASGSGWMKITGENKAEGEIRIHKGDSSGFKARRMGGRR
ncbi:MAG: hypothetical protein V1734_05545 [Nanoarchaeota archaeon]